MQQQHNKNKNAQNVSIELRDLSAPDPVSINGTHHQPYMTDEWQYNAPVLFPLDMKNSWQLHKNVIISQSTHTWATGWCIVTKISHIRGSRLPCEKWLCFKFVVGYYDFHTGCCDELCTISMICCVLVAIHVAHIRAFRQCAVSGVTSPVPGKHAIATMLWEIH